MQRVRENLSMEQLFEDAAAIYVHVELDEPVSLETLEEWRYQIRERAKSVFAEEFGIDVDQVELEVELQEGSLWAKITPKLRTVALILSLYSGVDHAVTKGPEHYKWLSGKVAAAVQQVTNGRNPSVDGYWNRPGVIEDMIKRSDSTNPPEYPPPDQ